MAYVTDLPILAQRIKLRRTELGLTQEQLAEIVETNQRTVSQVERGIHTLTAPTLLRFALALETSTDWLVGLSDQKIPYSVNLHDLDDTERNVIRMIREADASVRDQLLVVFREVVILAQKR